MRCSANERHVSRNRDSSSASSVNGVMAHLGKLGIIPKIPEGTTERGILKLDDSRISDPESEILNWTLPTAGCSYRRGDNPTKFLVFRDNRDHFVARKQTIC